MARIHKESLSRPATDPLTLTGEELTGPKIMKSEAEQALKNMKNRKARGEDQIPAELIKCLDSVNVLIL